MTGRSTNKRAAGRVSVASKKKAVRGRSRFPLKRILVPTDFSEASQQAARYAVGLAEVLGGRIGLVHVEPCAWPADVDSVPLIIKREQYHEAAHGWLAKFAEDEIPGDHRGAVTLAVGTPYHEITRLGREEGAELIVLATHGYKGLKHLFLGSTAERVVAHADCPVLTLRPKAGGRRLAARAAIRKILVATDFSEAGSKVVDYAIELARRLGAVLSLVHVIELPTYPRYGYVRIPAEDAKRKKVAAAELAALKAGKEEGLIRSTHLRSGEPHSEIVLQAEESGADLVVVGSHGHGGLTRLLLGSTAERVVRFASCPVLVARKV